MSFYLLFWALALTHLVLLTRVGRITGRESRFRRAYLRVLLLGLMLDNLVLALGGVLADTPFLDPATRLRFLMHAVILPFLTIYAHSAMRQVGVAAARSPGLVAFSVAVTVFSLSYGFWHDVVDLGELKLIRPMDTCRMTAVSGGVPIGTILTNVVMIGYSVMIARAGGPWAFLTGAAGIFIVNGFLTGNRFGFATGNLVEVFFVVCLLAGERVLGRQVEK